LFVRSTVTRKLSVSLCVFSCELDPIAEDFINDIKAVRPGVDASVFKEEHGTLKSH
jgi:hypothetical protein